MIVKQALPYVRCVGEVRKLSDVVALFWYLWSGFEHGRIGLLFFSGQ